MKEKIYNLKDYNSIIEKFKELSFKEKYEFINYLFITGNNDKVFECLKIMYKEKLYKWQIKKIDYLQLIYHINNKDKYNIDAIKFKLKKNNPKESWCFDLITEENLYKRLDIFKELIKSNELLRVFKHHKLYRNKLVYLYLLNISLSEEPIRVRYIEDSINIRLKKMICKKELSILDIEFVKQICNYIFSNLSFFYIKNNGFFIDLKMLYKLIDRCIVENNLFMNYTKEKKIQFNSIMFYSLKGILNLDVLNKNEINELIKKIDKFLDDNIDFVEDNIKIIKSINNKDNFLEEIENIIKDNRDDVSVIDLILSYVAINYTKLEYIYEEINNIYLKYEKNLKTSIKKSILLAKEIINLWNNGIFCDEEFKGEYRVSEFMRLVIQLFNGKISEENFKSEIKKLKSIDCLQIINWKMLEKRLKGTGDYQWLLLILEKIDTELDQKARKYLEDFYIECFNGTNAVYVQDFIEINRIIINNFDDAHYFFLINSIKILYFSYHEREDLEKNIIKVINVWEKIQIIDKSKFLTLIIMIIVELKILRIDFRILDNMIKDAEFNFNKSLLYMLLKSLYIKDIVFSESDCINLLNYLCSLYKNIEEIDDQTYSIIAQIAMLYIEKNVEYDFGDYDLIYFKDNKYYYIKTENQQLTKYYNMFGFEEISYSDNFEKKHMILYLIRKIFYDKIEDKGFGKKIMIPIKAKPKEILEELNKAIGFDEALEIKEKIRNGELVEVPWFNIYNYTTFFEDVVSLKWKLFYNSLNNKLLSEKKIIHLSSLLLLCKLDVLKVVVENDCYISNEIYIETNKYNKKEIYDLGRGILEEPIFYDDELEKLAQTLEVLQKNGKVFSVTSANIFSRGSFNKYDDEILKRIIENVRKNEEFCVITEDPFFLNYDVFSSISEGSVSLLFDSHIKGIITSKELFDCVEKLNDMNYNLNIGRVWYTYLIEKSNDEYIQKIIKIINNYKI